MKKSYNKIFNISLCFKLIFFMFCLSQKAAAVETRLKDLVNIRGVRNNTLVGYGVVFGLQQTGDTAASTASKKSVAEMMKKMGVDAEMKDIVSGNFASVIVTADLPPFTKSGDRIDIRIAANADATSLAGGTLFLTPLKAGDGLTYAVAQGPVVIGQADGKDVHVLTSAMIPRGATVEREHSPRILYEDRIIMSLNKPDFTTNYRIATTINSYLKGFYAESFDPGTIKVALPTQYQVRMVEFLSKIENLRVEVDRKAVVVLNERTGTVVMGENVLIGSVTISHKDLAIKIREQNEERSDRVVTLKGPTVGDVVRSLNKLGVSPKDLVGILQAIHAAGALYGEIKFI